VILLADQTGLKKETAAALAYLVGPITGVVLLLMEKDSFVRFHAIQSILTFTGLVALQFILGVTVILSALIPLTTLVGFVLWLVLMYKALQGERFEVPVIGKYANKLL
jgi:uncharacterized membrane protein